MKRISILGSAGSIGENTLNVVSAHPEAFEVVSLAVQSNVDRVLEQAAEHQVKRVAVVDEAAAAECRDRAPAEVSVLSGEAGVAELAADENLDMLVCAVVGMAGLHPVMSALGQGTDVALATKEVMVAAGALVNEQAHRHGGHNRTDR